VYAYLGRHYPAHVIEWVKEARWHGPVQVKLKKINMGRRPGGARDEAKVNAIAEAVKAGHQLDPIILVNVPGDHGKLEIADGWHRTLALKHDGQTRVAAYIGDVDTATGPWDRAMNEAKLNKQRGLPIVGDAGPKGPIIRAGITTGR
jgi:hypothetical protein